MAELMTIAAVADRLGVTPHYIYGLIKQNKLNVYKLAKKCFRVSEEQFQEYLDSIKTNGDQK